MSVNAITIPARVYEHARRASLMFAERFGRIPAFAAFAPGRVNLVGEHTDYNRGFVLPIAIERETIIVADRAITALSTLVAADLHSETQCDLTRSLAPRRGEPANYLLGVADQFQKRGVSLSNLDALVTSTVPIGAGLSSSAAVEVAFATLLGEMTLQRMAAVELARLCQAAEHDFPGTPCGIMDMFVSAAARDKHALLIDCRREEARHVPCDFAGAGAALLVIDTGVKHDLATSAYANRRATCEATARALGLPSLREASIESLNMYGLTNEQRRRALHVIAENTRTILAAEALALGDLSRFGELMLHSHASLRDMYEVSCQELDCVVDAARGMRERGSTGGVYGARMTGGGFGGCAIVLCAAEAVERVQSRIDEAFVRSFGRSPAMMFTTSASCGAHVLAGGG